MMKNVQIMLSLVDGSGIYKGEGTRSGRELIDELFGSDITPPPSVMLIRAQAEDGTEVTIRIPYDERDVADVDVGGK